MRHTLRLLVAAGVAGAAPCAGTEDETHSTVELTASMDRFEAAPHVKSTRAATLPRRSQTVTVVAKLSGDPITVMQARVPDRKLSATEKQGIRAALKIQQASVRPSIEALGGTITAEFQNSLNGLKVRIARDRLADLARVPGVVAVLPVEIHELAHLNSMPLIGAPTAWDPAGGNFHGEGIKIAIIDSGIDYTHAIFGGAGTAEAYAAAFAAGTEPADPAQFGPDAPKVKGGTDLVGDDYDASADPDDPDEAHKLIPHPDPNPLDCFGHGSHVAGSAAGFGVLSDGTTYLGPYDALTLGSASWMIGPGVAPNAELYAVRVFGCEGSTNVTIDAIEWAVDHEVDVINMSLGGAFGTAGGASAEASTNAARAGIVVVASAGNNGGSAYIVGSPSVGEGVISVASTDPRPVLPVATITLPDGAPVVALNANNAPLPGGPLELKVLRNADGTVSLGCGGPEEYLAAGVAGKIAVTLRGTCARVARAIFAEQAGAAAVIMLNTDAGFPPFEGPITANPDTGEKFTVTIPFLGVRGVLGPAATTDPDRVVAADGTFQTLGANTIVNPGFRAVAASSSSGPRRIDSALKPDVAAPGVSILSTAVGTGSIGGVRSGTSMAAPHVAGTSALARQAHTTWSAEDVKLAVVNTGSPALVGSATVAYRTSRAGTGLVQPAWAVRTSAVALAEQGAPSLSFGFDEVKSDFVKSKTIKVKNLGIANATFNVTVTNQQGEAHTAVPSTPQIVVPPGQVVTFTLTLTVPAATVRGSGAFREVAGIVTLTPVGGSNNGATLRVPYYMVPRGLSNVVARLGRAPTASNPTTPVTITNVDGPIAGNADFYALGLEDPMDNPGGYFDLRAVGIQAFNAPTPTDPQRKLLVFSINTWARWNNASLNEFDIPVDVNGDGEEDYIVIGVDFGAVTAGAFDGRLGVFVLTVATEELRGVGFLATAPTDGSTALLPFFSSDLCRPGTEKIPTPPCFSVANPRMTYSAVSFDLAGPGFDVVNGVGQFNPWTPAITQGAFISVPPNGTASSTVTINPVEWAITPARGVMIVTFDNRAGKDEASLGSISFP